MSVVVLEYPILFTTVIIPFITSVFLPIIGRRVRESVLAFLSGISLLYSLIVIGFLTLYPGLTEGVQDPVYAVHPLLGSFTMLLDGLSGPVAFSIALVTCLVAFYSVPYMRHRLEEMEREGVSPPSWGVYFMLYLMFSASMLGTVLSTNLIEFYLFLELTLLPSFLLIAFYGYGDRVRIAILYLLWTHIGALVFLVGILALGLNVGVFDIYNPITGAFSLGIGEELPRALIMPVGLAILIGLFVKMAVFGVHIWLPYAHAEAPTPVSALLSPNLIGIAGYALVRILYTFFPNVLSDFSPYLMGLAILTMVYGGFMALAQDDFKRLLAYSSVSQMGYLLLGIGSLNSTGIAGAMLHYVSHAVGKAVLFMVAGVLIVQLHGLRSISRMGGLASKMPLTAALALVGFMHITGVPPSLGLWSEILIVTGSVGKALELGSTSYTTLLVGLVVAIGLSTAYSFLTMKRIFFGELSEKLREEAREGGLNIVVPVAIIGAVGTLLFFYPSVFIDPLISFVSTIYG